MDSLHDSIHHMHHMLNHWALLVSAIVQWILGAIWYSPVLFVKPWIKALKISPDGEKKGLALGMVSSFIASLLLSFVLWHVIAWSGATSWQWGMFIGFLCWLGFIAAPLFPQGIYEQRPLSLFLINTGYWLVGMLFSGVLLAVWR